MNSISDITSRSMPANPLFGIEQMRGSTALNGALVAYAFVFEDQDLKDESPLKTPLKEPKILMVVGDFRRQRNLKEFIQEEFGEEGARAMEEAMENFKEEHQFDPMAEELENKLSAKMEIVPVPARMMVVSHISEVFKHEGDVFHLGEFSSMMNAQMSLGVFPILYQTYFKEQETKNFRSEIDQFLKSIEMGE